MSGTAVTKAILLAAGTVPGNQEPLQLALFAADGTPRIVPMQAATQATFAGADLTALKVELNAFLVKLKTAGVVAS